MLDIAGFHGDVQVGCRHSQGLFAEVLSASQDTSGLLEQLTVLFLQALLVVGTFACGDAADLASDLRDVLEQVLMLTPA